MAGSVFGGNERLNKFSIFNFQLSISIAHYPLLITHSQPINHLLIIIPGLGDAGDRMYGTE